ncbi:hypothetical protein DSO57_1000901 [Entomophthora muscae]|uniref:Uncharacterized protein n=1 Tax=Entomophthora muscae TaxID=34485 RepID=A0ACC2SYZ3_9FUNG|nr:hypothetical protein DSO57_1000901 [Entomophthora muscae]
MSACNNNHTTLRQVYQDLMAGKTPNNCKCLCLLPANSCQLQAQDCDTTMAGLEHDTVTHAEEEEGVDSNFTEAEAEAPLI